MKDNDIIYANFQPSETKLLKSGSSNQLLIENPILSSALSKIFPYLLLMDNLLETITWTNEDPYLNLLIIIGYSIMVMYWEYINMIIIPLFLTISFGYFIWLINSIIYDTKFNEKPTIDEILSTLHNITIRFEMILRPIRKPNLQFKNFLQIFIVSILLVPLNLFTMKFLLTPQKFIWLFGIFILTYHSPWSFSIRRLLWRSMYIRIGIFYLTGLNIKLYPINNEFKMNDKSNNDTNKNNDLNKAKTTSIEENLSGFTVLEKKIESPTRLNQVIKFEILENERRWIGLGWSKFLLPTERGNYCFENSLIEVSDLNKFEPPIFSNDLYHYQWEWIDKNWTIDKEFSKNKNNGWKYYDNNWENEDLHDGFSKFTRSRKWGKRARLIIDKKLNVYDE